MASSSRDRLLVIILGAVGSVVAAWFFWLSPTSQAITQATAQATQLSSQKTTLSQRVAIIDATAKDIGANGDAQRLLTLAAPASLDPENLLASFSAMAAVNGITLTSVQPQVTANQANQHPITIGVSGSYNGITGFIEALETNERPLTIQSISLVGATDANGSTAVAGTITVAAVQATGSTQDVATPAGETQ